MFAHAKTQLFPAAVYVDTPVGQRYTIPSSVPNFLLESFRCFPILKRSYVRTAAVSEDTRGFVFHELYPLVSRVIHSALPLLYGVYVQCHPLRSSWPFVCLSSSLFLVCPLASCSVCSMFGHPLNLSSISIFLSVIRSV
jgi:hypothetical protein